MKSRIEVMSIFAISLVVLIVFSMLNLVSASPSYMGCNNGQGVLVYLNPNITGCDVDCNTCEERTVIPCSGSPVRSYNECPTSSWNCGILKVGESTCVGASEERYLNLPAGGYGTFLTPLINKGYYYTYGSCNDVAYNSAWDSNFRECVELFNENGQVKARYHGFFLGDRCSRDDETVSLSLTEFNKQANKRHYCGGYCQPDYTYYCSNPGVSKTETGCQDPGEVCYKGWNDTNKNGNTEETQGNCRGNKCIQNKAPDNISVEIEPDFFNDEEYRDRWIRYSDVFDKKLKCKFKATDPNPEDTTLKINYTIYNSAYFFPFNPWNIPSQKGTINCGNGEECSVEIDDSFFIPGTSVGCSAFAEDEMGAKSGTNSTFIQIPSFDLQIKTISLINVIQNMPLITNKPLMARVWLGFDSDFINETDKDVEVKLTFNGKDYTGKIRPKNYPSLNALRANPQGEFLNGIRGLALLREIKQAEDSVNFFNLNPPASTASLSATVEIDPEDKIEENFFGGEDNNVKESAFSSREQIDGNYKVLVVIVSGIQLPATGISQAISTANQNYEFMIRVAAFDPTKTSLDLGNPPKFLSVSVDPVRVNNLDTGYIKGIRRKIFDKLSKIAEKEKADLVYGMVLNNNLMWDGEVIMEGVRNRGYSNVILIKRSTHAGIAVHELGHLFGLSDDYSELSHGVLGGGGWALSQENGNSLGSRLNIWPCPPGGCVMMVDVAEPDPGWVIPPGDTRVGDRYYSIMGNPSYPYLWINQNSYETFLNKLTK